MKITIIYEENGHNVRVSSEEEQCEFSTLSDMVRVFINTMVVATYSKETVLEYIAQVLEEEGYDVSRDE